MEQLSQGMAVDADKAANKMSTPYAEQDVQVITNLCRTLEGGAKDKKKSGFSIKKTKFSVASSRDGLTVDSWKMSEWDYKKPNLPTYARGLFTTQTRHNVPEIAIRGYDKFFNTGETPETTWDSIERETQGPYELTLKENGCIIFLSGLEDGTLLVCSKHSTGDRSDVVSHAAAGEKHIERQLQAVGKTKEEFARELRKRNATAVCELCDDDFEEHILPYGPDKAGLYLHGININVPQFMTYPTPLVHQFADGWGFKKVGLITMDTIGEVRSFLDQCAESGAHEGRDVEGFVVRCKRTRYGSKEAPFDWFFKYKFEEPYLLYRQWRECTKAIIAGKTPKIKKHQAITQEYLLFAKKRLAADPNLGELYNQNHGIIALRNDFLTFQNMAGSDAAKLEEMHESSDKAEVTHDVILVPIATIGCGKTTIAVALSKLFNCGHVQNDNIQGKARPPRFTKAVLDQLADHSIVTADRNNAQRHERKQLLTDVKLQYGGNARLVALYFVHDNIDKIRAVTQDRVFARGDNHQTIQATTDPNKVKDIMDGFLKRFEPIDLTRAPDEGFDACIHLNPADGSRQNLEIVVTKLKALYPKLLKTDPTPEEMDEAIREAVEGYRPDLRHTIPDRGGKNNRLPQQQGQKSQKKKPLEYMSIDVPAKDIAALLQKTFNKAGAEQARFYKQLVGTRRVQPQFHVTLMHRATAKQHSELWDRYTKLHAEADSANASSIGECDVVLERVVYDDRIMAIVVRLDDPEEKWTCVNKVTHITVGTRDDGVKPKESNDLLERWLTEGSGAGGVVDVGFEGRPVVHGVVRGVLSR